ncbi:MAG: sensor histidine kinase [Anaerolineae bacterium]|nr:MAG: sensor histidine kinase [Anaerolineae bacterium]
MMHESQKRQQLIEEEATRQDLARAERQAGVLAERQRLAREIHDTLAQDFTSIVLHLEAADAGLPADAEPARTHVARRAQPRGGLTEARRLVLALRPEPLEGASLPQALRRVAVRWAEETGVAVRVAVTGEHVALHPEAEVTLLRAAQEALTNVRKHAQARQVNITLSYMGDQVALDVQDDGVGFDSSAATAGFGLAAMRQRVEQLGGTVVVESAAGHGATVAVTLPLHPLQTIDASS